ncbi:MAG TPA: methyltransferase domain-containing protein [Verrucomicrobia bacterium]|nr:methyltransferase domain-containing protein [Verrucomicrobiota bacterium]HOB31882.1 methyltransferase domain-containing protein [Verrucomicrobiota bacterium]HOP98823.1 methyltransferase domain-containing protein [Verrucomicrobiota bacterium]
MFFRRRATQAEYFDLPGRPRAEMLESYEALASVNRLFVFAEPFQRLLTQFLGHENCRSLSILDLGAGDGSLGELLTDWAAKTHGWAWTFTNLDISIEALQLGGPARRIAGSALALPFIDNSFDLVIGSQMTHHLVREQDVVQHLREAWRVCRRGVFLSDLHRNPVLYTLLWVLFHIRRYPKHFREDGLLSVKRGFRVNELRDLALRAGVSSPHVRLYRGSRIVLAAMKPD